MDTLRFIGACVVVFLGSAAFVGTMTLLFERGKKGENGVIDLDQYYNNDQQGVEK